jgi:hypothetical protein
MKYEDLDALGCEITERIRTAAPEEVDELLRLKDEINRLRALLMTFEGAHA